MCHSTLAVKSTARPHSETYRNIINLTRKLICVSHEICVSVCMWHANGFVLQAFLCISLAYTGQSIPEGQQFRLVLDLTPQFRSVQPNQASSRNGAKILSIKIVCGLFRNIHPVNLALQK